MTLILYTQFKIIQRGKQWCLICIAVARLSYCKTKMLFALLFSPGMILVVCGVQLAFSVSHGLAWL